MARVGPPHPRGWRRQAAATPGRPGGKWTPFPSITRPQAQLGDRVTEDSAWETDRLPGAGRLGGTVRLRLADLLTLREGASTRPCLLGSPHAPVPWASNAAPTRHQRSTQGHGWVTTPGRGDVTTEQTPNQQAECPADDVGSSRPPSQSTWLPLGLADEVKGGSPRPHAGEDWGPASPKRPCPRRGGGEGGKSTPATAQVRRTQHGRQGLGKGAGALGAAHALWDLRAGVKPRQSGLESTTAGVRAPQSLNWSEGTTAC